MEIWRLLAHNHWYTLNIFGSELRLCARCSGYILGLSVFMLTKNLLSLSTGLWSQSSMIFSIVVLSIPLIWDWVTQSWRLRESTNFIRLLTGTLMGLSIAIFSQLNISIQTKKTMFLLIAIIILLMGLHGTQVINIKDHS